MSRISCVSYEMKLFT